MVASTVYNFQDQLNQIGAILNGYGFEVWNSHLGTVPVSPALSNLDNCIAAVQHCDAFLGIVRPFYGSGRVGERSITHEEFREAVRLRKPRWFLVSREVIFARQLLKPYMYEADGKTRTSFELKRNPVIDDLRVIDLYNDAIQNDLPITERRGHWVQEFHGVPDALTYIDSQFKDPTRIAKICQEMAAA